jgi:uncharacterized OsmC-like protein
MPSIENIGEPLVYKINPDSSALDVPLHEDGEIAIHLKARALEGMQKEAIVHHGPTNTVWRMVSDEGPYLNGTDLAPFPLAFYAAGMAFSFLSEIVRHAATYGISITSLSLIQDNFYTMEGSAIRGDMLAGAKPTEITVRISADVSQDTLINIIELAEASSPAQAYMCDALQNTFALCHNGRQVEVAAVNPSPARLDDDPEPHFDSLTSLDKTEYLSNIITKHAAAEVKHGVEGGVGSSLRSEQRRTLHVHTVASVREDGLKEAEVQLLRPIGSTFRFISDEASDNAPPSLAYLSAGVGFCFMTQLGRYANIVKLGLSSYGIVQANVFTRSGSARDENVRAGAKPVDTHLFVKLEDTEESARKLLKMGEQTCFLHAAMRTSNRTQLRAEINGTMIEVDTTNEPNKGHSV